MVLSLVVDNNMDLLRSRSTDIRAEHKQVGRISVHLLGFEASIEQFEITSTAVNVLLVLYGKLKY